MPIDFSPSEIAYYYSVRCPGIRQAKSKEWRGPCPVHKGVRESFAVDSRTGMAHCHSACGRGWDIISLEQELTGKDFINAKADAFSLLGKQDAETYKHKQQRTFGKLDRIYDYTDAEGEVLYQVLRYKEPKDFRQRRPDGSGEYKWGLGDVEWVPYNLQAVAQSNFVFIVEGEKDVESLRGIGLVASCNNGGAGHFKASIAQYFAGKIIAILPDNDEAGKDHAQKVAELLYPVAKSVKLVAIPGLKAKEDVTDYLQSGGTVDGLRSFYANAQFWDPSRKIDPDDRYIRTFRQEFEIAGGINKFWDMSLRAGVPTPWIRLTKALGGGLLDGEVYAIGGNTGSGKTSIGLQFAIEALRNKYGVLIFSMEMDWRSVMQRMVSIEARVDLNEYRELQGKGQDSPEMRAELGRYTFEFMDYPLTVSRKARVTPKYIVQESKRLKERLPKLDLIIVDHLQLMSPDERKGNEYESFTAISRSLKQAAVEVGVPVLLMSQTSRNNSHEKRTELELSDLRGCIDGAALILLADGRRKRMKEVCPGDVVFGLDNHQKLIPGVVEKAWSTGCRPVFRITTRFGHEIVATDNHPFRTPCGWKPLSALQVGDDLACIYKAGVSGECSDEAAGLCRFAGYMVGNGSYIKHRGISFTTPDKDVMDDFMAIVRLQFPEIVFRVEEFQNHYEIDLVRLLDNGYGAPGANPVRQWLIEMGMSDKRFDQKRVPAFVYGHGARGSAEFVSGYLMTDGCIKVARNFSVCFDTTSHGLAKDVQHLLTRLGVGAVVCKGTMNSASKVPIYRLSVVRQKANTERLLSKLTLFGKNGGKSKDALACFNGAEDENSHLLALPREYSIEISRMDWHLWRNVDKRIGRSKAREIANQLHNPRVLEWADSDVLWDSVSVIEPYGDVETWDMCVAGVHTFTANDMIVHNSGAIEEDIAAAFLIYPDKEDAALAKAHGRFEKGPVKTWCKVDKNRYGCSGVYLPLMHFKSCTRFDLASEGVDYGSRAQTQAAS